MKSAGEGNTEPSQEHRVKTPIGSERRWLDAAKPVFTPEQRFARQRRKRDAAAAAAALRVGFRGGGVTSS